MPLNIIRNDITKVKADVIVNTANPDAAVGAGVDCAIYKAAGWDKLLAERAKIGKMEPGEAKATPAFGLNAKYIIHTVGPAWYGGGNGEAETVAACYRNSLRLAEELGAESIAFPLISTGTLGFPKDLALNTAISEISRFLFESDMNVLLVVYNKEAFELSGKIFSDVKSYIEESAVVQRDYASDFNRAERVMSRLPDSGGGFHGNFAPDRGMLRGSEAELYEETENSLPPTEEAIPTIGVPPLEEEKELYEEASVDREFKPRSETFQQLLFRIIDRKDLDDIKVYKKANLDRKLFSKIKSNVNYAPSKRTALALAIALELNLDETMDLIGRAGFAFSPASVSDLIIIYFIKKGIYDIYTINCCLFDNGQPTLGSL